MKSINVIAILMTLPFQSTFSRTQGSIYFRTCQTR